MFHEKGVPRFYIQNLEHARFNKKGTGAFSTFLWRIKKLGHPFCYNEKLSKVLKLHFVKIWLYLKNLEKC
jgi:hypothetical protein